QLLGAGAEVDGTGSDRAAERHGVGAGATGDGLRAGNGDAVGAVRQNDRVTAAAQIDNAGGDDGSERDLIVLRATGDRLDAGDRDGVGASRREGQAVGAAIEVDRAAEGGG